MHKLIALAVVLMSTAACTKRPTFHVLTADACKTPQAVGRIGTKELAIVWVPPASFQYKPAECQGALGMADVGKDYPATVDYTRGVLTLSMAGEPQRFLVYRVAEAQ